MKAEPARSVKHILRSQLRLQVIQSSRTPPLYDLYWFELFRLRDHQGLKGVPCNLRRTHQHVTWSPSWNCSICWYAYDGVKSNVTWENSPRHERAALYNRL